MFKESNKFEKFESKVWLSSPTMHGPEIEYVKEAYETNWMSTVGKNINEVERMACEYIGCKYAVALSAGTASLHLAMKLAGIEAYGMPKVGHGALEGKKVFCSDMTFDATVNPVVYEGGEPVFIDTEYDTWNMDPVALEKAFEIYPDTKVVVVAHLYGTPGKVDELNAVIKKHNAILVEDAAESMGATYKGVQTGTFGKCSIAIIDMLFILNLVSVFIIDKFMVFDALLSFRISTFSRMINSSGIKCFLLGGTTATVDNFYYMLLFQYGIFIYIFVAISTHFAMKKMVTSRNSRYISLLVGLFLVAMMESSLIRPEILVALVVWKIILSGNNESLIESNTEINEEIE